MHAIHVYAADRDLKDYTPPPLHVPMVSNRHSGLP